MLYLIKRLRDLLDRNLQNKTKQNKAKRSKARQDKNIFKGYARSLGKDEDVRGIQVENVE